jgi:hypothetical protein
VCAFTVGTMEGSKWFYLLTKRVFHHSCRWSLWLLTGSICGPFSS